MNDITFLRCAASSSPSSVGDADGSEIRAVSPEWALPRSFQRMSSGDGIDTGPILALEPLSTILGVR
jgi:hypothetical protein